MSKRLLNFSILFAIQPALLTPLPLPRLPGVSYYCKRPSSQVEASESPVVAYNIPPAQSSSESPVTTQHSSFPTPRDDVELLHTEDMQHRAPTVPLSSASGVTQTQVSGYNISRLPKLNIPFFTGDPLTWQPFWDSFNAAIHSNQVLSNVQKLTYLRAQLQGEAARVISGFPLTSDNYMPSVDLLRSRFAKPHKLVNAHMQALIDLPNPSNTLTSLQQFYDSVESHTRSLTALGKNRDSYGDMLVPITLGKLPTEIKRNLARE